MLKKRGRSGNRGLSVRGSVSQHQRCRFHPPPCRSAWPRRRTRRREGKPESARPGQAMMALSEHPKSREVNTPPVSGLADPALPLGGYRIRGCGVVVAQEPSKLLGPVRVWSAAPASFLLSKDEIVHGRTARRAMPRAFIRPMRQSAYFLGISHYSSASMIMDAFNIGIFLAMAARLVARRPCNIEGRRGGWGLSARRHSGGMSCLFVLSCAA